MTLTTDKNGTQLTVHLSGELNTMTAPELTALLDKELAGVKALTLDFTECDYVSSAGLRVLLATFKANSRRQYSYTRPKTSLSSPT